jgi:hypothetical protein
MRQTSDMDKMLHSLPQPLGIASRIADFDGLQGRFKQEQVIRRLFENSSQFFPN